MTIFVRGKQKRVRRPQTIEGMDVDEFLMRNADPIWLHQNELWEYIEPELDETVEAQTWKGPIDEIPFGASKRETNG